MVLQHNGDICTPTLSETISSQLLCHLFYIELTVIPRFYYTPEIICLAMRCRLNPGHALLDLLFRIFRLGACFYYQGDEITPTKAQICTEDDIQKCRKMQPFVRQFKIKALSANTSISIEMDGVNGKRYSISNCPYKLRDIIKDQGLNHPYGAKRHSVEINCKSSQSKSLLQLELNRLLDTLKLCL